MSLKTENTLRIILYEGSGAQPLPAGERFDTLTVLLDNGYAVTRTTGQGQVAPADRSSLLVLGRFDDGKAPVGEAAGDGVGLHFQDITGFDSTRLVETVERARHDTQSARHGDWKPWFPVIDYDRCTNCMQCLSFCLFGVYGVDERQKIQVQNNDNCKTNCPACSRFCPEAAIMFPKYKAVPIYGDELSDSDVNREKMKVDISALLGGDVYSMLRERREKSFQQGTRRQQGPHRAPEVSRQTRPERRHPA